MRNRETTSTASSRPVRRTRGDRAGSSLFAVLAGASVVCAGATAAALAGSHAVAAAASTSQCQALPTAPSSPAPSPSQTATPGPTASGGGNASVPVVTTPNSTVTDLCVAVSAAASSSVQSGQDALFTVTVNPEYGKADDVTVQISASSGNSSPALPAPVFTVCGSGDGTQTCTLGTMGRTQTSQLQAKISVPSSAPTGDTITLVAKVTGAAVGAQAAGSVTGSATVDAASPTPTTTPSSSPTPSGHHSGSGNSGNGSGHSGNGSGHSGNGSGDSGSGGSGGSPGSTANTHPLNNLAPLGPFGTGTGGGSLLNPTTGSGNGGSLFPTIGPSTGPSSPVTGSGSKAQRPYRARTVADILPLNPGQLSGQVAGLIVLAIGIALVFARISLRKPRSSEGKQ